VAVTIARVPAGAILLSPTFLYRALRERGLAAMERLMGMRGYNRAVGAFTPGVAMRTSLRWLAVAALALPFTVVVFAQAPALNIRMGLWQVSTVGNLGGQMPGMDMSGMTAEQKAQMQSVMKNMMGPHTTVTKTCMTPEKMGQSNFMEAEKDVKCTQQRLTDTATTFDAAITCTGAAAMSGKVHVEATSPTAFSGTMQMSGARQGQAMSMDMTMQGKWLGADCGTVK
jgi:hypothetical protein